jgi:hypothetical protein
MNRRSANNISRRVSRPIYIVYRPTTHRDKTPTAKPEACLLSCTFFKDIHVESNDVLAASYTLEISSIYEKKQDRIFKSPPRRPLKEHINWKP